MRLVFDTQSVPKRWTIDRIGNRLKLNYGKSQALVRSPDGRIPIYGTGGLIEIGTHALSLGDSVVIGRKGTLDNPLYIDHPFWPVDTTFYTSDFDGSTKWFYYVAQTLDLATLNEATGVPSLSRSTFYNLEIPFPTEPEQSKIAEVLSTVDRAIEQTEAMIAKYQRIKTGLMHDLLTRGIDEHGQLRDPATHKFKPSPLGMIPEEWEASRLGSLAERITSGSRFWAAYYSVEGAKFIRIGNLTREHVNLRLDNLQHVDPPPSSEKDRTRLQTGDVLISVTADLGMIGVVPEDFGEAYINQHIALVRLNQEQVNPWWVGNFLASHGSQQRIAQLNESGAKAGLNLPTVSSIPVAVPSLDEQNETAKTLRKADDLIAQEKAHLEKLQRLKAGLMQDLLTGKVSVEPLLAQ